MRSSSGWRLRLAGELLLGLGAIGWLSERHMGALPTVPGTIRQSDVLEVGPAWRWTPSVRYEYTVAGKTYFGDRLALHAVEGDEADAYHGPSDRLLDALAPYRPGAAVAVHYDPRDPARSFLTYNPSASFHGLALMGALLLLFGVLATGLKNKLA